MGSILSRRFYKVNHASVLFEILVGITTILESKAH